MKSGKLTARANDSEIRCQDLWARISQMTPVAVQTEVTISPMNKGESEP
jgi:hypothetical protein